MLPSADADLSNAPPTVRPRYHAWARSELRPGREINSAAHACGVASRGVRAKAGRAAGESLRRRQRGRVALVEQIVDVDAGRQTLIEFVAGEQVDDRIRRHVRRRVECPNVDLSDVAFGEIRDAGAQRQLLVKQAHAD